jgi:predicted peroxiredoxin
MAKFLIHIHTGPDDPTKAALGCLVAATAVKQGHEVNIFLAGDGVHLLSADALANVEGSGTGKLGGHVAAIEDGGGTFYLSGMSAKARDTTRAFLKDTQRNSPCRTCW